MGTGTEQEPNNTHINRNPYSSNLNLNNHLAMEDPNPQAPEQVRIRSTVERLLTDHKETFLEQVSAFRPGPLKVNTNTGLSATDTVVGARIRPLLADEIEDGQVPGIYVRSKSSVLDIHELRERPHRPPILTVCSFLGHMFSFWKLIDSVV